MDPYKTIINAVNGLPEGADVSTEILCMVFGQSAREVAESMDPLSRAAFTLSFRFAAAIDWLDQTHGREVSDGFYARLGHCVEALVDAVPLPDAE